MKKFDLHFHTNIHRLKGSKRRKRLDDLNESLRKSGVDFVASTEHAYKEPLEAYLYLADVMAKEKTTVIPGIEAISKEGIDIIFLFEDEKALRYGLKRLTPFSWSIWNLGKISKDINAISSIAHPFTMGRTGIVGAIGVDGFLSIIPEADYVEIHNGQSLQLLKLPRIGRKLFHNGETAKKINYTFSLPDRYRRDGIGQAVGSDAHFPGHQWIVGSVESMEGMDWFLFLKKRIVFSPYQVQAYPTRRVANYRNLVQSARCIFGELATKQVQKLQLNFPLAGDSRPPLATNVNRIKSTFR
ncbi:PHP domain-containing protein [Magnetococcales bacterium HHB-1]